MADESILKCQNCGYFVNQHLGSERQCPGQSTRLFTIGESMRGWKALEHHENVLGLGLVSSYVVVDHENYNVCSVDVAEEYGEQRNRAELISAAPELLSALQKAVADYGRPGGPWNVPSEPGTWIYMAKKAIEKATGNAI